MPEPSIGRKCLGQAFAGLALLALVAEARADMVQDRLAAVVGIRAEVPGDARTARNLGTVREGSGVVIDQGGLVLTIGYLILEAQAVDVLGPEGRRLPAEVVGYDHDSGFGLLRTSRPLVVPPVPLGNSAALAAGDAVLVISHTGALQLHAATVASRREFAGYWEYLLEDAIFTRPPHASFGGAALIAADGRLVGIGSLLVPDAAGPGRPTPGNMFVPIDALKPILADLLTEGRRGDPPRPWLGLTTAERQGRLVVARVAAGSPAEAAGLQSGDMIVAVGGERVRGLAELYRKIWSQGSAGVLVPLTVLKDRTLVEVPVRSVDRHRWLRLDPSL
jgi:S1-C subfamily serine protease